MYPTYLVGAIWFSVTFSFSIMASPRKMGSFIKITGNTTFPTPQIKTTTKHRGLTAKEVLIVPVRV